MKNLRLAAAAALAGVMVLLSSGSAMAYVYPDCGIEMHLKIHKTPLTGGNSFDYVASAPGTDCDWTVTYRGETQTGNGETISGTFSTTKVHHKFTSHIVAKCEHLVEAQGVSAPISKSNAVTSAVYTTSAAALPEAGPDPQLRTCPISRDITLLPKGHHNDGDDDGSLPNTGGSNLWILVLGGVLLVGGGATILVARRRSTH